MFLDFMMFLRVGGFKVSLDEWLTLMDGLQRGLHGQTLNGFYVLCRSLLVKKETDLDKFEELFCQFFRSVDSDDVRNGSKQLMNQLNFGSRILAEAPDATVSAAAMDSDPEGKAKESKSTAIGAGPGTGGGIMAPGTGGKSIIHGRGDRKFRDWRTDCTIESRQFQMAFRLLRELSRKLETNEEELDIGGTIEHTCKRGGILDIRMQPPRRNRLKLMVLIDSGGSMKPYEELCSLLFQSLHKANTFSDLKIYYFHNCPESVLYKDPSIDTEETVKTNWVFRNISKDYKVIFVGDADMAMHELVNNSYGGFSYAGYSDSNHDGLTWIRKFKERYEHSIWLHPQEREENIAWMSESFVEIEKVIPMFRLSIDGLKEGMYKLMRNN